MIVGGINIRVARCATFSKTFNNPEKTIPRAPPTITLSTGSCYL